MVRSNCGATQNDRLSATPCKQAKGLQTAQNRHIRQARHLVEVIAEPGGRVWQELDQAQLQLRAQTLAGAKRTLLPSSRIRTHVALYSYVLCAYPKLGRFVPRLPLTRAVPSRTPWRTTVLLAVAIGLAAEQQLISKQRPL